ncbi:MAG: type II secretion system F family protein [bacterium]
MELIIITITVFSVGYLIFMIMDDKDESVQRRLSSLSSSSDRINKNRQEDEDSKDFLIKSFNNIAKNIAEKSKNLIIQKQLLSEAGFASDEETVLKHISKKVVFASVLGVLALILLFQANSTPLVKTMLIIIVPLFGFKFPDIVLKSKAKKRAEEVTYSLPDALDLLTVCVEAGLGLDSAISRVSQEQRNSAPILSQELQRVNKEVLSGIPRSDAFRNLLKRNSSEELRSFVSLLIQSDKFGTSIAQSLRVYSETVRVKRRQKAEELASKAGVKMSIPLILFILPATFIVILAPAAISMISLFSSTGGP